MIQFPDPIRMINYLWPHVVLYDKQEEIIYSVKEDDETYCVAGNMLGKDFTGGLIVLCGFMFPEIFLHSSDKPLPAKREVRIITTSVKDDHLRVLWGEIGRFITTCRFPLDYKKGGPLIIKHRELRKMVNGQECKISYCLGMVSEKGEGMAGHHAAYTLFFGDEASGIDDITYTQADTWAKKKLLIGNPNDCQNFFRKNIKLGNLQAR